MVSCRAWMRIGARLAFWAGLVAVAALSLLPQSDVPKTGLLDKWEHAAAYAALMASGAIGFTWRWRLAAALFAFGGLMEIAQSFTPDRQASFYDLGANVLGIAIAFVGARLGDRLA